MRTEDMLPICAKLDSVGFWSLEAWVVLPSTPACVFCARIRGIA